MLHVLGHRPLHQGYQGRHRPSTLLVLEHGPLRQGYQGQSIGHLSCTCWRIGPCIRMSGTTAVLHRNVDAPNAAKHANTGGAAAGAADDEAAAGGGSTAGGRTVKT